MNTKWINGTALALIILLAACSQVQEYKEEEKKPVEATAPVIVEGDTTFA